MTLLSVQSDAKTIKNTKQGYLTGILYMAPNIIGGRGNVCPMATAGCIESCLYTAGRAGIFSSIQAARIRRTQLYFDDRKLFMAMLRGEIASLLHKSKKLGLKTAVRLNGTSDLLPDEYIKIMEDHPEIYFYDYTKVANRFTKSLPKNYYLTLSRSENNDGLCVTALREGYNVAVVFKKLPEYWYGFKVINGDEYDARFLDEQGVVVGLKAKGAARSDRSGFVVG
jgi:hypothetical protein